MQKKDTSTSTGRKMLRYLLAGVTVTVPVVLSMMAIWWFYGWIDAAFRYPVDWFEWAFEIHVPRFFANLAALALTLTAIGFLGWFVATRIGRWFHDRFDGFFARVNPLYPPIKKSVGLILDTLGSDDGLFSRVVTVDTELVRGGKVWGLLLGDSEKDFLTGAPDTELNVFLIHGPVGNSGFAVLAPRSSVHAVPENTPVTKFLAEVNLRFGAGGKQICVPLSP